MRTLAVRSPVADWIAAHYPDARRIVEVGVGAQPEAALALAALLPRARILATDVVPMHLEPLRGTRVEPRRDDVLAPEWSHYEGADLIYSLRPPPELVPGLERVADRVSADLVAAPLSEDSLLLRPGWAPTVLSGRILAWRRRPAARRATEAAP